METSDYDLYVQLMDMYKQKRNNDYVKADEYLMAAQRLLLSGEFSDEERTELMNVAG